MIYPYKCCLCDFHWEVVKRLSEIDNHEMCPKCFGDGTRFISHRQSFYGEKVEDSYFCPALGTIIKNKNHRNQIAKSKGLEEIGNDIPPSQENFKKFEKIIEEKSRNRYREFFEPIEVRSA